MTLVVAAPVLRTFALLKQVPGLEHDPDLDEDRRLFRDPTHADINPWCRRALAYAIELAGRTGTCTAITMGPPSARAVLQEAEACGADRLVHLCDPALAGSDCLRTARALSALLELLTEDRLRSRDIVLVGRSTVDGGTSAVGTMVAECLRVPFIGTALKLTVDDAASGPRGHALLQNEGATETVEFTLPAVVAVAERSILPAKSPRDTWPDGSRITTLGSAHLGKRFDASASSPTRVVGVRQAQRTHRGGRVQRARTDWLPSLLDIVDKVETSAPPEGTVPTNHPVSPDHLGHRILVVSSGQDPNGLRALVGEGRRLAALVGAEVVAVGPPQPEDERHDGWAGVDGRVVVADTEPMAAAESIEAWLGDNPAWAVLGTPIAWDREVLSRLAVRLDAGLLSDLTAVSVVVNRPGCPRLIGQKPAGVASLAEVDTVAPTQIMTLRTASLGDAAPPYPSPSWTVHLPGRGGRCIIRSGRMVANSYEALERARVVVGVGQGIEPADYPYIKQLCAMLGAELAATRKVTDRGWMDHDRQVGVTARHIAPDLYLALALSGNQNHLAGVARARTIVAVNHDPRAAIFAGCDLGIVADWRAVAAALIEHRGRR